MSIDGYIDYQRREYCKDIKCPIQTLLDNQESQSDDYEEIRKICRTSCLHSTYEFHHWLIEKKYLIVKPE